MHFDSRHTHTQATGHQTKPWPHWPLTFPPQSLLSSSKSSSPRSILLLPPLKHLKRSKFKIILLLNLRTGMQCLRILKRQQQNGFFLGALVAHSSSHFSRRTTHQPSHMSSIQCAQLPLVLETLSFPSHFISRATAHSLLRLISRQKSYERWNNMTTYERWNKRITAHC